MHAADANGNALLRRTGDGYDAFNISVTLDGVRRQPDDVVSIPPTQNKTGGYYDFKVTPKAAGTAVSTSLNGVEVSGRRPDRHGGAWTRRRPPWTRFLRRSHGVNHTRLAAEMHSNPITSGLTDGTCSATTATTRLSRDVTATAS